MKCFSSLQDTLSREAGYGLPIEILPGTGPLYWNGGMSNSWKAAIADPVKVDAYCLGKYGKHGIYCGSPDLVMPDYCGECENDHIGKDAPVPSWKLS